MCDSCEDTRHWRYYVGDMIEFGENVLSYTKGLDQDAFTANSLTYDATLRNIELIGEAATHIPDQVRQAYPEIEWRSIVGARNRVAHAYMGLDDDVLWDIIQTDVPDLLPKLHRLLASARSE
ncbi:MAG: DUF86 domain-containing protein [Chloroflexota bacterium]|nr:DUF86 domain-containing protein [Chloroflexota bacterium]